MTIAASEDTPDSTAPASRLHATFEDFRADTKQVEEVMAPVYEHGDRVMKWFILGHAAISGMVPVAHIARTHGGTPWSAEIHALRPDLGRQAKASPANDDLSAAA